MYLQVENFDNAIPNMVSSISRGKVIHTINLVSITKDLEHLHCNACGHHWDRVNIDRELLWGQGV